MQGWRGGVRAYRFPVLFVLRWLLSAALARRHHLGRDAAAMLAGTGATTRVEGAEHIPRERPFLLAMNHYERDGLRVWWPALLVARAASEARPGAPPPRWLVTDRFYRFRLLGLPIPQALVAWFIGRVAHTYDLMLVARVEDRAWARATALRRTARVLSVERVPVGVTPEGERSSGAALAPAIVNAGAALAWVSRGEVPILPAGVFEDAAGRLVVRFGPTFTLDWPGLPEARRRRDDLASRVMGEIAALIP
jgi:1-acyl-sn-glycerol-3-phosphate acyltransferase